jgi:hypothetical protein
MRNNNDIQRKVIRFVLILVLLFSLIAGSCSSRKNKLDRSGLIPQKELVSILTDVYLADGLLTIPTVRSWFSNLDTLSSYFYIIEKHGYSKETMDKTLKYYFIKKPKVLINIYDQVLGILSEMESLAEKEVILKQGHISNLWNGEGSYSFPDPSGTDSTGFDIPLLNSGIYTFVFTATLFPDDQSANPRITAYSCHPDSLETGKKRTIETMGYIKDGYPHTYTLTIIVPKGAILHLHGRFFDSDNPIDESGKHVIIENISITYTSAMV